MRILLFITLIICSQQLIGQNDSIIFWDEDNKLTKSDFKGSVIDSIKTKQFGITPTAVSFIGLSIIYKHVQGNLQVSIKSYFDRNKSFYRDSIGKSTLDHEQCHFDISELYVRKMRKKISNLKRKNIYTEKAFNAVIDSLNVERYKYNDKFDFDTFYGSIESVQNEWIERIQSELNELSDFKCTIAD